MKKRKALLFLLIIPIIISGCSLRPQKMASDKVEEIAKEVINPEIYLSDTEPSIEDSYYGRLYIYEFMDERGIPFTVKVTSPHFSLVEYQRWIYEDYVEFRTDYRAAIMNYYHAQVEELFSSVEGIGFDEKFRNTIIINDEATLELLEDILIEMDTLYDFEYASSGELRLIVDKNAYWEDYRPFDLLIKYNGKQENIFFTVSDDKALSAEDIHKIVENLRRVENDSEK